MKSNTGRLDVKYPNIEKWRKDNKLSYDKFAKLVGCSKPAIRNMIFGFSETTIDIIKKTLNVTGMKFEYAFNEKPVEAQSDVTFEILLERMDPNSVIFIPEPEEDDSYIKFVKGDRLLTEFYDCIVDSVEKLGKNRYKVELRDA